MNEFLKKILHRKNVGTTGKKKEDAIAFSLPNYSPYFFFLEFIEHIDMKFIIFPLWKTICYFEKSVTFASFRELFVLNPRMSINIVNQIIKKVLHTIMEGKRPKGRSINRWID